MVRVPLLVRVPVTVSCLLAAKITAPVPAVVDKLPTVVSASFKVRVPAPEVLDRFAIFPEKTDVGKLRLDVFEKATDPASASIEPEVELIEPLIVSVFDPISRVPEVRVKVFATLVFELSETPEELFTVKPPVSDEGKPEPVIIFEDEP
jgi:hypothetical protein